MTRLRTSASEFDALLDDLVQRRTTDAFMNGSVAMKRSTRMRFSPWMIRLTLLPLSLTTLRMRATVPTRYIVGRIRVVVGRIALGDDRDQLAVADHVVQQVQRLAATHRDRHDRVRKEHAVSQGKDTDFAGNYNVFHVHLPGSEPILSSIVSWPRPLARSRRVARHNVRRAPERLESPGRAEPAIAGVVQAALISIRFGLASSALGSCQLEHAVLVGRADPLASTVRGRLKVRTKLPKTRSSR